VKTITEFTGNILRQAAQVGRIEGQEESQAAPPAAQEQPAPESLEAAPEEDAGALEGAAPEPAEAPPEVAGDVAADTAEPPPPAEPAEPAEPPPPPPPRFDAEKIAAALNLSGDRLARLVEALTLAEKKLDSVQRVRVVVPAEGEAPPAGARKQGDFYYLVDLVPKPQRDAGPWDRERSDDRRGRDRGRGGGRPGGGGDRGRPSGPGGGRGGPGGRPGGPGGGRGVPGEPRGEREPRGKEIPSGGPGWTLERAPHDPNDRRGGDRGRGPGRGRPGGGGRGGGGPGGPRGPGGPPRGGTPSGGGSSR
jgi:hypothetical protein